MSDENLINVPLTLGEPADTDDGSDDTEGTEDEPSIEDRFAQLEARFNEQAEQFTQREQTYQSTISRLIQGNAPAGAAAPAGKTPEIDWNDLPDPVEKPDEFKRAIGERVTTSIEAARSEVGSELDYRSKVDALWNGFRSEYPDLAKKEALANTVAASVIKSRGVDGASWALDNPAEFSQQVAARMKAELGITDEPGEGGGKPNSRANRTAGVKGGSKSTSGAGGKGGQAPKGFLAQLKQSQLESGLI